MAPDESSALLQHKLKLYLETRVFLRFFIIFFPELKLSYHYKRFYIWIMLYESRNQNHILWWKNEKNRVYSRKLIIIFIYSYLCCNNESLDVWFIQYDSFNEEFFPRKHCHDLSKSVNSRYHVIAWARPSSKYIFWKLRW